MSELKIYRNSSKQFLSRCVFALATTTTLFLGSFILFSQTGLSQKPSQILISQNSSLAATSAQKETLYLNNDREYSYNLKTAKSARINGISIPAGATIVGRYEPAKGGLRYVANAVIFNGKTVNINAASEVLKDVKDPRDTSAAAIAEDAAIGAGASVILGEALGEADAEEIVGGAAAGGVVGNVTADRVVVIKPDVAINLYSR
ncbi:MAG: hypothetical protein ACRC2R_25255 [Xenococcaceae cyanobacterium]